MALDHAPGDHPDDIAIIGWAQTPMVRHTDKTETQLLLEVVTGALDDAGLTRADVGFTCAGSCDYVAGQAFSFVQNTDAIGAWPPKRDSHVEMDGAWALYEAYVRLLLGDEVDVPWDDFLPARPVVGSRRLWLPNVRYKRHLPARWPRQRRDLIHAG